jgi:tRNA(adenine34) deaminase
MDRLDAMALALEQARLSLDHDDVPVGAIVLNRDGHVIAARHNERELTGDPTAHAEILALRDAAKAAGSWRLGDHTLVVTLEPCAMCAGAAVNSRIATLVYGAADMKAGACLSLMNIGGDPRLNHMFEIIDGVMAEECAALLSDFFEQLR